MSEDRPEITLKGDLPESAFAQLARLLLAEVEAEAAEEEETPAEAPAERSEQTREDLRRAGLL